MSWASPVLLIGAVAAVGVLHTIVPDHWVPIALIARQRSWSRPETARAALQAGTGHVLSTLVVALAVWAAGLAFAERFGHLIDIVSGVALFGFGGWVAVSAWRELHSSEDVDGGHAQQHGHSHGHNHGYGRDHRNGHDHPHPHIPGDEHDTVEHDRAMAALVLAIEDDPLYAPLRGETAVLTRHVHIHQHERGTAHLHWHDHLPATAHPVAAGFAAEPPFHRHRHKTTARTAMLLILGSSPMVEGIPAFFAAAKYGGWLISTMAAVFALGTIVTYVALCTYATAGLQRLRLGAFERYGEVLSGAVIALIGIVFGLQPLL
jgi:ABC-type nickel/cobalt efflux system permease component RcnA